MGDDHVDRSLIGVIAFASAGGSSGTAAPQSATLPKQCLHTLRREGRGCRDHGRRGN